MSESTPAPTGLARRRRRISDQETGRRMLTAAMAMIHRSGLTVSLDHISFEDVIRDAGVSRSAVYRRWPYKDLFFSDLLQALAAGTSPAVGGSDRDALDAMKRVLLDHLDWLDSPGSRLALLAEALRVGAHREFAAFHASAEWRTYIALQATFLGLPDGELRTGIQRALTESERTLNARTAAVYEQVTALLGLRLRPATGADFPLVARVAGATLRGLVVMAPASPDVGGRTVTANPFGAPEPAAWSAPALGMAGVIVPFLEPDPAVRWDADRTAAVRHALASPGWPVTPAERG